LDGHGAHTSVLWVRCEREVRQHLRDHIPHRPSRIALVSLPSSRIASDKHKAKYPNAPHQSDGCCQSWAGARAIATHAGPSSQRVEHKHKSWLDEPALSDRRDNAARDHCDSGIMAAHGDGDFVDVCPPVKHKANVSDSKESPTTESFL
jgi:hypothetical protein